MMLLTLVVNLPSAQTTTFILIRHAEKDTTQQGSTMMMANPPLTAQGKARANSLIKVLKKYTIDSIYGTNFIRTKETVQPIALHLKKEIFNYNHKQLQIFAQQLKQAANKTFLIVGHSNSTPTLANYLVGENIFSELNENVYNKIYIITIKNNQFYNAQIIDYEP